MNRFSPSDAALEGFRLTRERPGTILAWSGVYFAGIMLMALVMAVGLGSKFVAFLRDGGLQSGDTEAFGALLAQSWPAFLVVLAAAMLLLGVITGGIYRLVLRPEEPGFAHLKLGRDEVRLALVHVMLFGIGMTFLFAVDMAIALGRRLEGAAGAVAPIGGFLLALAMIWVGVRLVLVTPLAFAERRISLRDAWMLSRGQFWSLLGMIILAVIFYIVIWALISIIGYLFVTLAGGTEAIMDASKLRPGALLAFLITFVIQLLLPILQVVMIYAPLAVAYKQITGPAEPPAET